MIVDDLNDFVEFVELKAQNVEKEYQTLLCLLKIIDCILLDNIESDSDEKMIVECRNRLKKIVS
jgi:hypothetical protein